MLKVRLQGNIAVNIVASDLHSINWCHWHQALQVTVACAAALMTSASTQTYLTAAVESHRSNLQRLLRVIAAKAIHLRTQP